MDSNATGGAPGRGSAAEVAFRRIDDMLAVAAEGLDVDAVDVIDRARRHLGRGIPGTHPRPARRGPHRAARECIEAVIGDLGSGLSRDCVVILERAARHLGGKAGRDAALLDPKRARRTAELTTVTKGDTEVQGISIPWILDSERETLFFHHPPTARWIEVPCPGGGTAETPDGLFTETPHGMIVRALESEGIRSGALEHDGETVEWISGDDGTGLHVSFVNPFSGRRERVFADSDTPLPDAVHDAVRGRLDETAKGGGIAEIDGHRVPWAVSRNDWVRFLDPRTGMWMRTMMSGATPIGSIRAAFAAMLDPAPHRRLPVRIEGGSLLVDGAWVPWCRGNARNACLYHDPCGMAWRRIEVPRGGAPFAEEAEHAVMREILGVRAGRETDDG